MTIRGSCLCGSVVFTIAKAQGPMESCHCNRCRKVSGSASMVAVTVNVADFQWLRGVELIRTFAAPILYEPPVYRSCFCANCGSPVPDPEPRTECFEVPAGTLDDDPGIRPDKHIFVEMLPAWDRISDSLPQYTLPELYRLRTGAQWPPDLPVRRHRPPA